MREFFTILAIILGAIALVHWSASTVELAEKLGIDVPEAPWEGIMLQSPEEIFSNSESKNAASKVVTYPSCERTKIVPNARVRQAKTGIANVDVKSGRLYVGGQMVGEWPALEDDLDKTKMEKLYRFQFSGERHSVITDAQGNSVVAVVEDMNGKIFAEKIGEYRSPYCYTPSIAIKKGCDCKQFGKLWYGAPSDIEEFLRSDRKRKERSSGYTLDEE